MYLQTDLQTFDLHDLPTKFDVILVEPPLEEYQHTGVTNVQFWDWQKIMDLDIAQVRIRVCTSREMSQPLHYVLHTCAPILLLPVVLKQY